MSCCATNRVPAGGTLLLLHGHSDGLAGGLTFPLLSDVPDAWVTARHLSATGTTVAIAKTSLAVDHDPRGAPRSAHVLLTTPLKKLSKMPLHTAFKELLHLAVNTVPVVGAFPTALTVSKKELAATLASLKRSAGSPADNNAVARLSTLLHTAWSLNTNAKVSLLPRHGYTAVLANDHLGKLANQLERLVGTGKAPTRVYSTVAIPACLERKPTCIRGLKQLTAALNGSSFASPTPTPWSAVTVPWVSSFRGEIIGPTTYTGTNSYTPATGWRMTGAGQGLRTGGDSFYFVNAGAELTAKFGFLFTKMEIKSISGARTPSSEAFVGVMFRLTKDVDSPFVSVGVRYKGGVYVVCRPQKGGVTLVSNLLVTTPQDPRNIYLQLERSGGNFILTARLSASDTYTANYVLEGDYQATGNEGYVGVAITPSQSMQAGTFNQLQTVTDPANGATFQLTHPINGNWSTWQDVGCDPDAPGNRNYTRTCTNPAPQFFGKQCVGSATDSRYGECPINGGWGPWRTVDGCSAECGDGVETQLRECINPPPLFGGTCTNDVDGGSVRRIACNQKPCVEKGRLQGYIVNAVTGEPIRNATIQITSGGQTIQVSVGSDGFYQSPELAPGTVSIYASADGFISTRYDVGVPSGISSSRIALSPAQPPSSMRIVLSWGCCPPDLDTHLKSPSGKHLWYANRSIGIAQLDVDDVSGYGPETTTIPDIRVEAGHWTYSVYNFNHYPSIAGSGATVNVYLGDSQVASWSIPNPKEEQTSSLWWNVFEFDEAGRIFPINATEDTFRNWNYSIGQPDGTYPR